ncbi:MAG: SDR family oxidoreductase, partial [Lapillicoccus sp.]
GTMRCVRAAAPHLLDSTRGPAIVLVSSVNGLADFGDEAYSSAKAALPTLAKNLAVRFGSRGIRVNVVAPGTIRTRVWDAQPGSLERLMKAYPLGRIGEPEEVAAAIAFLCSSDASWVTGITLPVDGGALAGLSHVLGQL